MSKKLILIRHGDDPPDDRVEVFAVQQDSSQSSSSHSRASDLASRDPDEPDRSSMADPSMCSRRTCTPFCIRGRLDSGLHGAGHTTSRDLSWGDNRSRGPWCGGRLMPIQSHEFGYVPNRAHARRARFPARDAYMSQAHFHTFAIPRRGSTFGLQPGLSNQAFRWRPHICVPVPPRGHDRGIPPLAEE